MDYYKVTLQFNHEDDRADIAVAYLSQLPFESFETSKNGINAFIQEGEFKWSDIQEVISEIPFQIHASFERITRINWNKEWENNFHPIQVNEDCVVRAPFHDKPIGVKYDIIIMPKMSFGTGHHATTTLMIRSMMHEPLENKSVLDAGCGTGILSIVAEKLQAGMVLAYDIDDWAVVNALENITLNNCANVNVEKGSVEDIQTGGFDVILANINKNVLLRDIPSFSAKLKPNGSLFLSGFYEKDCTDIIKLAGLNQLKKAHIATLDKWALIKFEKLV